MNLPHPLPPLPRTATMADLSSLVQLEQEVFDYDQIGMSSFRKFIQSSYLWVFEQDEQIRAYILLLKRKGSKKLRIYSLAVSASSRGLGLGKKLLEYAISQASREGYQVLSLEVKIDNGPAIKLYENLGFTLLKKIEGFYSDGSTALVYQKTL